MLRDIDKKFNAERSIDRSPSQESKYEGHRTLAAAQRNRPVPGAGHYDDVNEQYFRATQ